MTSSTRKVLTGSAIVVTAGLCAGLFAYYSGARAEPDASDALAYIPGDVTGVAFADVRDIVNSGFSRHVREVMPTGEEKNRLLEETGIDIARDIDTVVAGLSGTDGASGVVILRGRFDRNRIEQLALGHGATSEQYGGRSILVGVGGTSQAGADQVTDAWREPALAFLETDLLALGDLDVVRRAIDAASNDQAVAGNADLMRLIGRADDGGNAWFVGRAGAWLTRTTPVPGQVRSQFDAIEWLAVSADINEDLRGVARAEVRDEESANQLRTVLAGALAAARMLGAQDDRLASALNSVQTSGEGRDVELAFTIPASAIDAMRAPTPEAAPPAP